MCPCSSIPVRGGGGGGGGRWCEKNKTNHEWGMGGLQHCFRTTSTCISPASP